jgi:uncharacterized protein
MKPSRYNHLIRRRNQPQVLYNSWHHRWLELDNSQSVLYGGLSLPIAHNLINQKDPPVAELVDRLYRQEFLIDDHRDELRQIELLSQLHRFDPSRMELWAAPTTQCQQDCQGCPYSGRRQDLSPEGWESLFRMVSERAPGLKSLTVNWWGGEPALAWPAIVSFDERLADLSARHGFEYCYRIIGSCGEAYGELHPRLSRPPLMYLNIEGCRDRALSDRSAVFLGTLSQIMARRRQLPRNARVRIVPNLPGERLCRNIGQLCRSAPDLEDSEVETLAALLEDGLQLENLPRPKLAACQAVDPQSLIIDPSGDIYRCWRDVGQREKALPDWNGDPLDIRNFRWLDWNPFQEAHCRVCNILPWCMGGCRASPPDEDCSLWHFAIREMLELTAAAKKSGA